jgi:hypothetical protein
MKEEKRKNQKHNPYMRGVITEICKKINLSYSAVYEQLVNDKKPDFVALADAIQERFKRERLAGVQHLIDDENSKFTAYIARK